MTCTMLELLSFCITLCTKGPITSTDVMHPDQLVCVLLWIYDIKNLETQTEKKKKLIEEVTVGRTVKDLSRTRGNLINKDQTPDSLVDWSK